MSSDAGDKQPKKAQTWLEKLEAAGQRRCGECEKCITYEVTALAMAEEFIWAAANGDVEVYLARFRSWMDFFESRGLDE